MPCVQGEYIDALSMARLHPQAAATGLAPCANEEPCGASLTCSRLAVLASDRGQSRATAVKILDRQRSTELEAFDAVCRRLGGFNDRVLAEWADGYLTALAAGPRVPWPLEEWLPRMAGDAFERAFCRPARMQSRRIRHWSAARSGAGQSPGPRSRLLDQPEALRLHPLVSVWGRRRRTRLLVEEHGLTAESAGRTDHWRPVGRRASSTRFEDFADDWHGARLRFSDEAREVFDEILLHVSVLMPARWR